MNWNWKVEVKELAATTSIVEVQKNKFKDK